MEKYQIDEYKRKDDESWGEAILGGVCCLGFVIAFSLVTYAIYWLVLVH